MNFLIFEFLLIFFFLAQGFEPAIQIDGKVYSLKTNTVWPGESQGPVLFFTKNRSSNSPVLINVAVQNSVIININFLT